MSKFFDFFDNNNSSSKSIKKGSQDFRWLEEFVNDFDSTFSSQTPEENIDGEFKFGDPDTSFHNTIWVDLFSEENETSTENKANDSRSRNLDENFTQEFIHVLKEEDFEFGYKTRSEELINEQLSINALATRNWLNKVFLDYFSDQTIVIGILRIIGRFDPVLIFPQGQTMALAALAHQNDEIKELGIRAFEQWCSIESLEILKQLDIDKKWLREYVDAIILDFEEQLCHI